MKVIAAFVCPFLNSFQKYHLSLSRCIANNSRRFVYLSLLVTMLSSMDSVAQYTILYSDASANPLTTDDVSVCQSEQFLNTARIVVSNNAADNATVTLNLAPGMEYVPGCIEVITTNAGITISDFDISDLANPIFTISPADLNAGDQFTIQWCKVADCTATVHQMGGGTFKDNIEVCGDAGCNIEDDPSLNSYDLLTPSVSMSSSGPITAAIGTNVCRDVTLTNGGQGYLDSLKFYILDGSGTSTTSLMTAGGTTLTPVINGDTLCYWLDSAIFPEVGNGDAFLDNGEQVMLTRCYDVTGCDNASFYGAYWGCPGRCMSTAEIMQQTNLPNLIPNVSFGFETGVNKDYCYKGQSAMVGGTAVIQRFEMCNTGNGTAANLSFELYNSTPGSGTGQNYFSLEPGQVFDNAGNPIGTTSAQTSLDTETYFQTDCSQVTGNQAVRYELDGYTILPGECLYIDVPTYANNLTQECDAECNPAIAWYFFNRSYAYQDICEQSNYGQSRQGIAYGGRQLYRYDIEMPTDFNDCDEFNMDVLYSNFFNDTKENGVGTTELKIDITDTGLLYNGTGIETFKGIDVVVTQVGDTICVSYPPDGIPIGPGTFELPLKATCSAGAGTKSVRLWHEGQYDDSCPGSTYHLACLNRTFVMHCPDPCPEGGATPQSFKFERVSLGLTDANNNGIPDDNTTADPADVKLHRASNCDTIKGTWEIYVYPNTVGPNAGTPFNHLYIEFDLNDRNLNCTYYSTDNLFEPIPDAEAVIYPAGGGAPFNCTVSPTVSGDIATYDLTPCKSNWEDGDSIVFCALYQVTTGFTASGFNSYVTSNEVYTSYIPNPTGINPSPENKYTCDKFNDYLNVYQHYFSPFTPTPQNLNGCSGTIAHYTRYYINAQTGDVWYPNEYRPFTYPDKYYIEIDDAFQYRPGSVRFGSYTVPDADVSQSDGVLTICNLRQFFSSNGGPIQDPDETWSYGIFFNVDPTCEAEAGIYSIRHSTEVIGNGCHSPSSNYVAVRNCGNTEGNSGTAQLFYDGPQPFLEGGGVVQTSTAQGCWEVILNNGSNNIDASNTWFYLDGGAGQTLEDDMGNLITPDANGFYQLGDNVAGNSDTYTVCALTSECDSTIVNVLSGWHCSEYPVDNSILACADTVRLVALPLMSEVQLGFESQPVVPMELCETQSFELKMTSAQAAFLDDPRLSILIPNGVSLSNLMVEYPCGSGNIEAASFTNNGNLFLIDIEAHSAMAADGMPGTIDALAPTDREACITFDMDTDCDFVSSSGLIFQAFGKRPCGDPAINNGVRVRSSDLQVDGVVQPHGASVSVTAQLDELRGCTAGNNIVEVNVDFVSLGSNMTSPNDKVEMTLDPGVIYVPNSLVCCSADPNNCFTFDSSVTDANGFTTVIWNFPSNPIDITDPVNLCHTFEVVNAQENLCDELKAINIKVNASAGDIVCTSENGGFCENVQTLTGRTTVLFTTEKIELSVNGSPTFECNPSGGLSYDLPIAIDSMDLEAGEILVVDIYCTTPSGTQGAFVQSEVITGPVTAGTTVNISGVVAAGVCNPDFGIMANIGTTNNDNLDQCICGDLTIPSGPLTCPAVITHAKEFTSITQTGEGMWDVKWTITVDNTGLGDGLYNLNDIPAFDDDITICDISYSTTDAPGNLGNPGPLMMSNDGVIELAIDQPIIAGATHTYCMIICVQADPSADPVIGDGLYTSCESATNGNPAPGEGLYNMSELDTNDDGIAEETDEVCTDLPCQLEITSVIPTPCKAATSTYDLAITVSYFSEPACLINVMGQTFPVDGSGTQTFTLNDLVADGTMGVTISAFFTCEATCFDQAMYNEPAACSELACSTTKTDVDCNGDANGTASVTVSGGNAPYTYSWSSVPAQTTQTATGLSAGTYTVVITDANNQTTNCSANINEPTAVICSVVKGNDITCNGDDDGRAISMASGGISPYTYAWSNGEATSTAIALVGGTNSVTVTDANGCTQECTIDIVDPASVSCTISNFTNPLCAGEPSGTITVTGTGGTGALEYSLDGGAYQPGSTFSAVTAGPHVISIRDANGCLSSCNQTLTDPPLLSCSTVLDNQASCGMNDGGGTVTASGGSPTYTYAWDNGETTATASSLGAGMHSVTVTDANNCTAVCDLTVTSTTGLSCDITAQTDVSCNAAADGSLTVTGMGGTMPYTYVWSNAATAATISGLSGGTYTVTITDNVGCEVVCSAEIIEATAILCSVDKNNDITCNGETDGSATVTASGGTPGYTYLWSSGETTLTATMLPAGTNMVTVTDNDGCTNVCTVEIIEPVPVACTITSTTDPDCNGAATGSITVLGSGGTGILEYSLNGGAFQLGGTFNNVLAGNHVIIVQDENNCTSNCMVVLTDPAALSCSVSLDNQASCGLDNGAATVTPVGGTMPYTYLWDNTETTAMAVALSAGTHTVTVTDANDCTTSCQVVVTTLSGLGCSITASSDVSCNGAGDGSATVGVTGGSTPYIYAWSNGDTAASISGLSGGDYVVTVTDDTGCTVVCDVTIEEATALLCSTIKNNDISCNGEVDGGASVSASGGVPGYTYLWSSGETTTVATALGSGVNFVTVTDSDGCTNVCQISITEPTAVSCTIDGSTDPLCATTATGTITASGTGGVGVLTYSLDGGAFQISSTFNNVAAGPHTVTVSDSNDCTSTCTVTLTDPPALTCSTMMDSQASCGMDNGAATVTAAGGTPAYTYLWDNTETTASAVALSAGTHSVTVTDDNGCNTVCQVVITTVSGLACEITSSSDVTCNGAADGTATVAAMGGNMPYTYAWSNGASTASITGLSGATYTVTITEATGCDVVCSVVISEATALLCSVVKDNDISCNGEVDGGATITASGGVPGYTYVWTSGETTTVATALGQGINFVTVTDNDGCTNVCQIDIIEPPVVSCSITAFDEPLCAGTATGSITSAGVGGVGTLSYSLDGGAFQLGSTFNNVSAGPHTITVSDANGCTSTCTQTLTDPPALTCSVMMDTQASCGMSDGAATTTTVGGTSPFTYLWDNTETTATATALSAGNHSVTVTDANDCTTVCQVVISSVSGLSCEISSSSDVTCNGAADGTATVAITGGSTPYVYEWSNSATTASITDLAGADYFVTVTDATGCTVTCDVTISEATALLCSVVKDNDISCNGEVDGGATITASGGVPGYTYVWTSGETTTVATALGQGINFVTVTDSDGCTNVCQVDIIEPATLTCSLEMTPSQCMGQNDGTITTTVVGGTAGYMYAIDGGANQVGNVFNNVAPGTHSVIVTDANGCESSPCTIEVTVTGCEFDLALTKKLLPGEPGVYDPSDVVTYRIEVCNQGQIPADNISVIDYVPSSLNYITSDPINVSNNWMVSGSNVETTLSVMNGQLVNGGLLPNACVTVDVVFMIDANAPQGMFITNFAEISSATDDTGIVQNDVDSTADSDPTNDGPAEDDVTDNSNSDQDDHDPESIQINFFDLALTKALANGQAANVAPGDDVTYTITVYNQGQIPADNVEVTDYVPSCMTNADADWSGPAAGPVTILLSQANGLLPTGGLLPGEFVQVDITLNVSATADSSCDLTNFSEISNQTDLNSDPINDIDSQTDGTPGDIYGGDDVIDGTGGDEDDHDAAVIGLLSYDLALSKTLSTGQAAQVAPGNFISYTITVVNQGAVNASMIEITDYIPTCMTLADPTWMPVGTNATYVMMAGVDLPADGLAPMGIVTKEIVLQLNNPVDANCDLTNRAEISNDDGEDTDSTPDGDVTNDPDNEDDTDEVAIEVLGFDLALTKDLSAGQSAQVAPGDLVSYTITVINQGEVNASTIEITDYIPSCMTLADATWTASGANATYTMTAGVDLPAGGLAPLATATKEIILQLNNPVDPTCDLTNRAEISGDDGDDTDSTPDGDMTNDPDNEDDTDEVAIEVLGFDLALTKDLSAGQSAQVAPGDLVSYTITVINQGEVNASTIEITDYIPSCMTLADATWTASGANATYTMTAGVDLPAGGLAPLATATKEIILQLNNPVDPTCDLTNRAEISSDDGDDTDSTPDGDVTNDPDNEDDTDEVAIEVLEYDLGLSKTLSVGQEANVAPGSLISYTISVVNQGQVNASFIEITDYIPACMTLEDPTWTQVGANATYTMTAGADLPAGGLAPMATVTKEIILRLDNPIGANCDLTNRAEISNDDGDDIDSDPDTDVNNDPTGEDDSDEVGIGVLDFDLALTKNLAVGQTSMVMPGDNVEFTFTVFNQGDIAADNIQITDYIPADFILNDADWSGTNPANTTLTVADGDLPTGGLLPGTSTTVNITLTVQMTAINGNTYTNEGEISMATDATGQTQTDLDSDPDNNNTNDPLNEDDFDLVELTIMGDCDLALTKTVNGFDSNGDGTGGIITFDLNIINQGGCTAYNVSLVDYILPGFTLNDPTWFMNPFSSFAYKVIPGPIAPGETFTVPISFTVTSFDPNVPMMNWAEITGSQDFNGDDQEDTDSDADDNPGNDGMPVDDEVDGMMNDEDDHDIEEVAIMDLALDKNLDASNMAPYAYGDDITFNICVTNEGNITATNVTVVDNVPAGFTFDPAANPTWTSAAPQVSHIFAGPILQGQQVCEQIVLTFVSGGTSVDDYTNVAEITEIYDDNNVIVTDDWDSTPDNDDGDQSEDDEDAEVFRVFDLALSKTTSETGPFTYGQSVTFNVVVTNQGSIPAYDVELVDYIPCGYTFDTSMGWTYDAATGNATTTIAGPVMPGESAIVPLVLTLQACADSGAWTNLSEITAANDDFGQPGADLDSNADSDPNNDGPVEDNDIDGTNGDEDDHDVETIDIFDLAMTKTIDNRGPYVPGDIVEFKINLYNQGNVTATNFEVTDYLNEGFSFTAGANNVGWVASGSNVVHTYTQDLNAGATATVSLFLEVVLPANATIESWYNEAEVSNTNGIVDADSTSDNDPNNDNDVQPGDDNDDEINEHGGTDDEDDNDVADILVTGEIGDRVWKDLDGNGIQDAGEPGVSGVLVTLTDCAGNEIAQQTTAADGSYLFGLLLPGSYMVNFNIDNLPSGCAFTYHNNGSDDNVDSDADLDGNTECIDLEAGEFVDNVDAGLIPLASLGNQVWHDLNGDGIFDSGEPGIADVKVELYDENGFLVGIMYTNASGQYFFDDLYPGNYYVKFYIDDYEFTFEGQGGNSTQDSDVDGSNGVGTTTLITLGPGETNLDDFDAGLYVCAKIGEIVWLDYNQNDLQDGNENGINGVKVKLYKFSDNAWIYYDYQYTGHKPGTPSDDGYYKFCVAPGRYYVEYEGLPSDLVAVVPNYLINDNIDSDVTGRFGPNTTDEFTVVSTQEKCDIGAGYYTQATIGDYVWMDDNANGMRESNEQGISDIVVRAYDFDDNEIASATTDNDGQFMMDQLAKQTFYLKFDLPSNLVPTAFRMGSNGNIDSDINNANGPMTTPYYTVWPGTHTAHVDGGVMHIGTARAEVEIAGINAETHNKVEWTLDNDINVSHYVIEKATSDTEAFVEIAKVLVDDNTTSNHFLDYDVLDDDKFDYRIRAVYYDGAADVSEAVTVRSRGEAVQADQVSIFPNPVVDELSIELSLNRTAASIAMNLYGTQGELVKENFILDYNITKGNKAYRVDVSDLLSGMYTIRMNIDNQVITKKIIVIE